MCDRGVTRQESHMPDAMTMMTERCDSHRPRKITPV
jgi:hypothetical protein